MSSVDSVSKKIGGDEKIKTKEKDNDEMRHFV